jgi:superfamily I DNA/RNA helicase
MRLEKWFISNLDDSQRQVIVRSIDENLIVKGVAGSGKTNLAIHRALQAKGRGSYAIITLTKALARMIAYGMETLGLDKARVTYDWAWENRGFDLSGDVYCEKEGYNVRGNVLYLVNDTHVRKFERINEREYGLDFTDWVDDRFYNVFGRRHSWFKEVPGDSSFNVSDTEHYELIPSGILYKPSEPTIDYLIIDEAQDFNVSDYHTRISQKVGKSLSLFGDSNQQMNPNGSSMELIENALKYKTMILEFNYRLPKTIAKMADLIQNHPVDLISNNKKDGGNSDYPTYPKPLVTMYQSKEEELKGILNKIQLEDLDDVAILVPTETEVKEVNAFLNENGIRTQVHYRTNSEVPFRTIDTLDFSNNDLPCILTYYEAKGSEFDHVFIPFANQEYVNKITREAFYVACTRSSRNLYISYTGVRTSYLNKVNKEYIQEINTLT